MQGLVGAPLTLYRGGGAVQISEVSFDQGASHDSATPLRRRTPNPVARRGFVVPSSQEADDESWPGEACCSFRARVHATLRPHTVQKPEESDCCCGQQLTYGRRTVSASPRGRRVKDVSAPFLSTRATSQPTLPSYSHELFFLSPPPAKRSIKKSNTHVIHPPAVALE